MRPLSKFFNNTSEQSKFYFIFPLSNTHTHTRAHARVEVSQTKDIAAFNILFSQNFLLEKICWETKSPLKNCATHEPVSLNVAWGRSRVLFHVSRDVFQFVSFIFSRLNMLLNNYKCYFTTIDFLAVFSWSQILSL